MHSDYSASALAAGDSVRIVAARTTATVAQAQSRHGCSPTVTAALGRLLTGAALMGPYLKGRERITLQINGDGPVRGAAHHHALEDSLPPDRCGHTS